MLLAICPLAAQPGNHLGSYPPTSHHCVKFESQSGETFTVYVDGDIVNSMPQDRVTISDMSGQTHEVVVVLRRPAEKAAVLHLRPVEADVFVRVSFDVRNNHLQLYTPAKNRAEAEITRAERKRDKLGRGTDWRAEYRAGDRKEPPKVRLASDGDVDMMVLQLQAESFDSDRLALAKAIIGSALFTSDQIARLGKTIDFSNSQVDFLKYAYAYCSDPLNYSRAIEILTFSSDRKKVTDYIASQE